MFSETTKKEQTKYIRTLVAHCSMSLIHSNSDKPFLEYREAENIFCDCFGALNVSRSDIAVDAVLGDLGIGIKTFIEGTSYQKIAEFDKKSNFSSTFDDFAIIKQIAKMRNYRLNAASKKHGLEKLIYHYIVRYKGYISIFECPMRHINIESIRYVTRTGNTIAFSDGVENYRFSISKSTLYMEFDLSNPLISKKVNILENPSEDILRIYENQYGKITLCGMDESDDEDSEFREVIPENPYLSDSVILPLFSTKKVNGKKIRYIPEKSGMNQWNAYGRTRNPHEVYIPVPAYIHKNHPGFFPPRTDTFNVELPGGKILSAKLCQTNDKGLMSNPNKDFGDWLLGRIFEQKPGELVTYEKMQQLHVNAVRVSKLKNGHYYINIIYVPEDYELGKMIQVSSSR